jgi:hypothetical protein
MVNYWCDVVEKKEKVSPEKKGLLKVNCWEIASRSLNLYADTDDPVAGKS